MELEKRSSKIYSSAVILLSDWRLFGRKSVQHLPELE